MRARTHWLSPVLVLVGTWLTAPAVQAQTSPTITPNARVRVWAAPRAAGHEGTVVAIDTGAAGTLVWRRAGRVPGGAADMQRTDTIPLAAVQRLEVHERRRSGARTFVGGFLGLLLGLPLGAFVGDAVQGDCYEMNCLAGPLVGGVAGGLTGLMVGAALGARPVDRWEPALVPGRMSLRPLPGGFALTIAR